MQRPVLEGSATTGCVHAQNVSAHSREFLLLAQGVACGGRCLVEGFLGQDFASCEAAPLKL